MRIDFLIIGAQKCGTTNLASQLAQHPQICFCRIKEPHYFSKSKNWKRELTAYHKLFAPTGSQLCGEASTSYTFLPEYLQTHLRLFAYNPELKLIYIMRQPVQRIISHYVHRLIRGAVKYPFQAELLRNSDYINRSRYGIQIKPYLELFPHQNIILLILEEYIINTPQILERIASFLDISPAGFIGVDSSAVNASPGIHQLKRFPRKMQPQLSVSLKQVLWRLVEDDVCTIEHLLGRRLNIWRKDIDE